MSTSNNSEYELLAEHFGYPPVSLLDDVINTVNVLADRALDSVERLLLSIPPQNLGFRSSSKNRSRVDNNDNQDLLPEEAAKLEIENGTHQLETLLNASIDKNFDIFELYAMNNILTVKPENQPYIRLSHYEGLDFSSIDSVDRPTLESINQLRRQLQASQKLHSTLESEYARNEALLCKLRAAVGSPRADLSIKKEEEAEADQEQEQRNVLGFLRDTGGLEEGGSEKPVTTTTEFSLSQLQALRTLSKLLQTILPDLKSTNSLSEREGGNDDFDSGERKTWRRERAAYIEGASRRYLEVNAGLEMGPNGDVRDGEWQGPGRGLSKGEVEGLEQVVTMLGPGSTSQDATQAAEEGDRDVKML